MDKTDGKRLGMDAIGEDDTTLLIERVKGGLMGAWNENNLQKVQRGDRIVGVNDAHSDAQRLVDECKQNQILKMKIKRDAGVAQWTRRSLGVDDAESDADLEQYGRVPTCP